MSARKAAPDKAQLYRPPSSAHQDRLMVRVLLIRLLAEEINSNKEGP